MINLEENNQYYIAMLYYIHVYFMSVGIHLCIRIYNNNIHNYNNNELFVFANVTYLHRSEVRIILGAASQSSHIQVHFMLLTVKEEEKKRKLV